MDQVSSYKNKRVRANIKIDKEKEKKIIACWLQIRCVFGTRTSHHGRDFEPFQIQLRKAAFGDRIAPHTLP
jgi:hypothetical protein